jgi:hypothetical protein
MGATLAPLTVELEGLPIVVLKWKLMTEYYELLITNVQKILTVLGT